MARFEAVFDDGDFERKACWRVIEWTEVSSNGNRTGNTVKKFNNPTDAADFAMVANYESNQAIFANFG